jgi:hypothetical protein
MTTSPHGALERAALLLLTLTAFAQACAPEFNENACASAADCFSDEVCGEAGLCIPAPPPTEASVDAFTATPETINPGDEVTLSWTLSEATSAVITAPGVVDIALSAGQLSEGSLTVTPEDTITYTITATSEDDVSDSATVTVTVEQIPAPEITTFAASPETVEEGSSSTLSWEITGATAAVVQAGGQTIHTVPAGELAAGSFEVTPDGPTTYTLTASSGGGDDTATAAVNVQGAAPVIDAFSATPTEVIIGQNARLAWQITGADTIEIVDGAAQSLDVSGADVADGSLEVPINTALSTFTLRATNAFDTTFQTVSVTGAEVLSIASFTASPDMVAEDGEVTLSWSVDGRPDTVELTETDSAGTRQVDLSGLANLTNATLVVRPSEDTTYDLDVSADSPSQLDSAQASVSILPPLPTIVDFSASATEIAVNGETTLSWQTANADTLSLTDDAGNTYDLTGKSVGLDSSTIASIPADRVFTLTATNAAGDTTATVTVTTGNVVTASITSNPMAVLENEEVTLTWASTNATSIEITGPSGAPLDLGTQPITGGTLSVFPLTTPVATYTITAQGFGGPAVETVDVTVDPRVSATFFASDNIVPVEAPARDVTLTWTTNAATSVAISAESEGVTTPVDVSGKTVAGDSVVVNPTATTTYTFTATGSAGDETTSVVTVEVYTPASVTNFSASLTTIEAGQTTRLSWATVGATNLTITDSSTGLSLDLTGKSLDNDFIDVRLERSTLFSLTVTGANASNDNESLIVTVTPAPLRITEIMYNPSGGDDQKEWIEIYNEGDASIDLSNYSVGAGAAGYDETTLTLAGTIPPRGCVVVGGPASNADNGNPGLFLQEVDFDPDLDNGTAGAGVALVYDGDPTGSQLVDTVVYGAGAPGLLGESGTQDPEVSPGVFAQGSSIGRVSSTTDVFEVFTTPTPGRCFQLASSAPISPQTAPTGATGEVTISGYALVPDLIEFSLGQTALANCAAGANPDTVTCDYAPSPAEVGDVALGATRAFDYAADGVTLNPRPAPAQTSQSVAAAFFFTDTLADPGATFGCSIDDPGVTNSSVGTGPLVQGRVFIDGITNVMSGDYSDVVVEIGRVDDGVDPSTVFDAVTNVASFAFNFTMMDATYEAGVSSQDFRSADLFMRVSTDGGASFVYCDGAPASYGSDDGYDPADSWPQNWGP